MMDPGSTLYLHSLGVKGRTQTVMWSGKKTSVYARQTDPNGVTIQADGQYLMVDVPPSKTNVRVLISLDKGHSKVNEAILRSGLLPTSGSKAPVIASPPPKYVLRKPTEIPMSMATPHEQAAPRSRAAAASPHVQVPRMPATVIPPRALPVPSAPQPPTAATSPPQLPVQAAVRGRAQAWSPPHFAQGRHPLVPPSMVAPLRALQALAPDGTFAGHPSRYSKLAVLPAKDELTDPEVACCHVCFDGEAVPENQLLVCEGILADGTPCNTAVHQSCYGVNEIPEGEWLCALCAAGIVKTPKCAVCHAHVRYAMKPAEEENTWAHMACAWWTFNVSWANQDTMEPIVGLFYDKRVPLAELRSKLAPVACKECGVADSLCVACNDPDCPNAFHVWCAISANLRRGSRYMFRIQDGTMDGSRVGASVSFCDDPKHLPAIDSLLAGNLSTGWSPRPKQLALENAQVLQCSYCLKYRKAALHVVQAGFSCSMALSPLYRKCSAPQEMTVEDNPKRWGTMKAAFLQKVQEVTGQQIRTYTLQHQPVDLLQVYTRFALFGGYEYASTNRYVAAILRGMPNYSPSGTSSAFQLKKLYGSVLLPFEDFCEDEGNRWSVTRLRANMRRELEQLFASTGQAPPLSDEEGEEGGMAGAGVGTSPPRAQPGARKRGRLELADVDDDVVHVVEELDEAIASEHEEIDDLLVEEFDSPPTKKVHV